MTERTGPAGRLANALLGVLVLVATVVQLTLVVRGHHVLTDHRGELPPVSLRVIRFFSYFTIQSNLLVAATGLWLAAEPTGRSALWRVLRLNALVGITVTGLIYVTLLRPLVHLTGVPELTDVTFHYVSPVAAVVLWLACGPRRRITDGILGWSLVWPALYVAYTLAHGAVGHWYPYPFIDVTAIGYATALRNGAGVAVLLLGLGVLYRWIDGALARPRPTSTSRAFDVTGG